MSTVTFRAAEMSDLASAISILREAAEWLVQRQMPLWDPESFTISTLTPRVEQRELLVGSIDDDDAIVCIRLRDDPDFWPDVPTGEAAYLHKIAVRRSHAGRGLTRALVDWSAGEAASEGRKYLRLDCAPRPALIQIYSALDFQRVDERKVGAHVVIRMQRPVRMVGS